jgi:hypothetical protein
MRLPTAYDGRYGRLIEFSIPKEIKNLRDSMNEYTWIQNFVKEHHPKVLIDEVRVCKEMAELLPIKIASLMNSAQ